MDPINDKPFSHLAEGILFECDRCDFRGPVKVSKWGSPAQLARAVAEMTAYHAFNIWPQLNGFQGYDTLQFRFTNTQPNED